MPEALHYNASLSETRRDSQAILRHAEIVSASITSQAEGVVIAHEDAQSQNPLLKCRRGKGEVCLFNENLGFNRVEHLNDKSLSSYHHTFLSSKTSPHLASPEGRKAAFTLAEVLITLGIIGVVAALTLPSLIQHYEEKTTITRLKKTYSQLNQAFLLAAEEHSTPEHWGLTSYYTGEVDNEGDAIFDYTGSKLIREYLTKFLKGRNCESINECLGEKTLTFTELNNTNSNSNKVMSKTPAFELEDGTIILFGNTISENCTRKDIKADNCSDILVLFPNKKHEFRKGVNDFMFSLTKTGIYPHGRENALRYPFTRFCNFTNAAANNNGHGCTAWILQNENMDYLHCREKLSWDGQNRCK